MNQFNDKSIEKFIRANWDILSKISDVNRVKSELEFTNKEQYLNWRDAWRQFYKNLSHETRQIKSNMKIEQRSNGGYSSLQAEREYKRSLASRAMRLRKASKILSNEQRLKENTKDA